MTRKNIFILLISFFILNTYYLIHTTIAFAQQEVYLGVYPPLIQINALTPASIKTPITIQNLSTTDVLNVSIQLKPFTASNSYKGDVSFLGSSDTFPGEDPHIFDKMEVLDGNQSIDSLTLAPGQQKTLTVHIALPKDEPPSDYYFSIVFISKANAPDQNTISTITGGIATNVILSVGPEGPTTGNIQAFSSPLFIDHGPVNFSLLLQNSSSHFITPRGFIIVHNMFGQAIGKVTLLPVNVLAKSNRYIPDTISHQLQFAVWPETFLLGPYSATLSITLSEKGPVFERTIYFFAMPFQVLIGIVVIIVAGVFIALRIRQRLKK